MPRDSDEVKIALVGAGSASFGRGTIADIMASQDLQEIECTIALHDIDERSLEKTTAIAQMMRKRLSSSVTIGSGTDRKEALEAADFVIISVAQRRFELWEQDFRVPRAFGFRHVLGENGGPGALLHTLRSLRLVIPICHDMEELCPDALVLNFTNPESRVIMGIDRLTEIKSVGLCHGVLGTRNEIASVLKMDLNDLKIVTGGLNHLFWVLSVADARTGEDLYPKLRKVAPNVLPPLSNRMMELFELCPFPSDDHIGEYLSFAHEHCTPLWPHGAESRAVQGEAAARPDWRDAYLDGTRAADDALIRPSGEIAVRVIEDIVGDRGRWEAAVNVPNSEGYIENLPEEAVVEVPAVVDASGVHPEVLGPLPEALACICRLQVTIQSLIVRAYQTRSRDLLLQALVLDPVVDSADRAEKMLDHMLELQRDYLPSFS